MLLEQRHIGHADDYAILLEPAFERLPVGRPPVAIQPVSHDFENNQLVMALSAALFLGAVGGRAAECRQPANFSVRVLRISA
jgi:hypothetical protein